MIISKYQIRDYETVDAKLDALLAYRQAPLCCYPALTNGITIVGGATAWVLGAVTQLVPVNTLTLPICLHEVLIEYASTSDIYVLILYYIWEGHTIEIGRIKTNRERYNGTSSQIEISGMQIPANSRINAKLASSMGGSQTLRVSLSYHEVAE